MRAPVVLIFAIALLVAPSGLSRVDAGDAGLIAYQRDPKGGVSVVPASGGVARRLSTRHGQPWYMGQGEAPVWSPDGKWIAIVDARRVPTNHECLDNDDLRCPAEIYVIRPDGSGERRVTTTYDELYAPPVWSPDSHKLAFTAKGVLRVVSADGSGLTRLPTGGTYAEMGSWSPDGKTIAYTQVRDASNIFLIGLDGQKVRLTRDGRSEYPKWSPEGRWIAFLRDTPAGGESLQVYVMRPDGSGLRALVTRGSSNGITWSPDSSTLAFATSIRLDTQVITTVDVASGRRRQLVPQSESFWTSPSWSPDGKRLVATVSSERPLEEVWIISHTGPANRRIVSGGDSASWQPKPK